jgi:acetylornithine deacetylase/succinyl-diaminopimelate desuccinylase-like protein
MNATTHLQNLLRLNTTNPPGNEILAANYLAEVLQQAGYKPTVIESAPGRGNVIARYKGAGAKRPLLLYNHLDVVPAEPEHWSHDPFSGDIDQGVIWGRGALDMKDVVTQQLMVMLRLAEIQPQLSRDVIFAGCADEEVGGEMGLGFLVREHRDLIDAEIGLSESGAIPEYVGDWTLYPIQCGEKGNCGLLLRANAAPGHGASPDYDHYAIRYLSIALERLTAKPLPIHITATVRQFLTQIAPLLGIDFAELEQPATLGRLIAGLPYPELRASLLHMTRNSAAPTLLHAGTKINVVPSQAEAQLDGRTLPGQTCADLMAEVRAAIGDDLPVEIIHLPELDSVALEAPSEGPIWDALAYNLKRHDPDAIVIPMLLAGGTDAKHVAPLGMRTYGFSPMKLPRGFEWHGLVHGHDERIPLSALDWGVDVLYDTVLDLCV